MKDNAQEGEHFRVDKLKIEVYPTHEEAGAAAARAAAEALKKLARQNPGSIGVIFATGASQLDTLSALTAMSELPWDRVLGFHMDEYVGLPANHPAAFRHYLRERLVKCVPLQGFFEVNGTAADPESECLKYAEKLRAANPQLCLLGVGENGHLAFNDPGVADFEDPADMKLVHLDPVCRGQQAAEGWFATAADVPEAAMTLTIPALMRVPKLIASVPGARKARIMRRVIEESVSTACPATILRTHPDATIYLDREAASELSGMQMKAAREG